ncbi:alpha/beta hydrolase family protein [Sphingobium sp.]|uniref:alpha/beta hydrolase family protein n=1 Tax=Sphingobium sp. TaxID=1912891 RepID=UPI003B3AD024
MKWLNRGGFSSALMMTTALSAQTPPDPIILAKAFGAREGIQHASLSPDGNQVAFITPQAGRASAVSIVDLQNSGAINPVQILQAAGTPERLSFCKWASNSRLLCNAYIMQQMSFGLARVNRIVALDKNGGNLKILQNKQMNGLSLGVSLFGGDVIDWSPGEDGHVLMIRQYVPEQTTGTRVAQTLDGFGVDDVDSVTLRTKTVERPRQDAREFISDGHGRVRVMGVRPTTATGYEADRINYFYRPTDGGPWKPLSVLGADVNGFDPYHVDRARDLAYGLKSKDGRMAAYSKALDDDGAETLLFAHPQVDVDGFVTIGRNRRAVGVSYVTDRREVFYFDPTVAKLASALSRALPDQPLVQVIDASDDEQKLLLWAGSDVDPGRYYLLDRTTNHMESLVATRPQLDGVKLSPVKAVSYPAADGTMIPGYLTLPPGGAVKGLPAIVMPHGGPGARDEWGFDWLSQYYASLGYAVLQPNFRGSTGYGDAWFEKNGYQRWRTAIGDVDDGARWLVKEGIAQQGKLAIVGWSYGGYAALQSAVTEPGLFKAVVAIAPVTDLDRLREEHREWSDYARVSAFIGTGAHIEAGSPARHADAIKVPVMMFHGTYDRNVGVGQSRMMHDRLKSAGGVSELITYDGLDHYLDDSDARVDMLTRSAAFIAKALHP